MEDKAKCLFGNPKLTTFSSKYVTHSLRYFTITVICCATTPDLDHHADHVDDCSADHVVDYQDDPDNDNYSDLGDDDIHNHDNYSEYQSNPSYS